jgi:hypothetical protein
MRTLGRSDGKDEKEEIREIGKNNWKFGNTVGKLENWKYEYDRKKRKKRKKKVI